MSPSDDHEDLRSQLKKAYEGPLPRAEFAAELHGRLQAELEKITPLQQQTRLPARAFNVLSSRLLLAAATVLLAVSTGWFWWQKSHLQAAHEQQVSLRNEAEAGLQQALAAMDRYDRAVHDGQKPATRDVRLMRKEWLQAAVNGYETLAKENGSDAALQSALARTHFRLAEASAATGNRAQAVEQYCQGLAILDKLAQDRPETAYRDEIANGCHNLGVLYRETGQTALADRAFQQALDSYRQVQPAPDQSGEHSVKLGDLYSDRAFALAAAGKLTEALDWYAQAIQALEGVPQPQLQAQDTWRLLFQALAGRSRTLASLGQRAESLQDWDRALELASRYSCPTDRIVGPRPAGKPLIWGADAEGGAPFVFDDPKNPGNLIGYEMDLAKALAREMGRPIQFKQHPWVTLLDGLDKGEYDFAMNGVEIIPDRLEKYRFSRPYYLSKLQLVVRADEQRFRSVAEARRRKDLVIGTLGNTAAEWQLDRLGIKRKSYPGQLEPFIDLIQGRLDGVLADLPAADYYVRQHPKLKYAGEPIVPSFYAIAVHPKNEALLSEINVALERLLHTGELRRIYEKWGLWNTDQEGLSKVKDLIDPMGQPGPAPGKRLN